MALEITEWVPTGAGRPQEPNPWTETVKEIAALPRDGKTAAAVMLRAARFEVSEDGLIVKDKEGRSKDSADVRKFNNQINAAAKELDVTILRSFGAPTPDGVRVVMRAVIRQTGKGRKPAVTA